MKHRYSKERRILWGEFVYMYRNDIKALEQHPGSVFEQGVSHPVQRFVKEKIRPFMGFSPSTADIDVWLSCRRFYLRQEKDLVLKLSL